MFPTALFSDSHNLVTSSPIKDDGFDIFKKWIITTYGDGSKTKTITWSKYLRIHKVLSGRSIGESPKFKFWVKTKGFTFLQCAKPSGRPSELSGYVIALPNRKTSVERVYKRVAVVEEFFDIISDIHTNFHSRNGKHAGQKRTYRTIIESYAFLPREAVTHFLMSCKDCRGRMHLTPSKDVCSLSWGGQSHSITGSPVSSHMLTPDRCSSPASSDNSIDVESDSFYSSMTSGAEGNISLVEQSLSQKIAASPTMTNTTENKTALLDQRTATESLTAQTNYTQNLTPSTIVDNTGDSLTIGLKSEPADPDDSAAALTPSTEEDRVFSEHLTKNKPDECFSDVSGLSTPLISSPLKRTADSSMNLSPTASKKSSDDADDDDDDDDDEKSLSSTGHDHDPERLKAFNMFCRLFVDENLDRLVPISKQPKEKVQQILNACDRQFPEFHDRARKRIRTYLKSCRRMRRAREMNGHENVCHSRPTPPHLTSPLAESLLDQACKNESQNIKRMRMGLEPIAILPPSKLLPAHSAASQKSHIPSPNTAAAASSLVSMPSLIPGNIAQGSTQPASAHRMFPDWRFQHGFRQELSPFFNNGFFRPPFPGFPTPLPTAALQATQAAAANQLALQHSQVNTSSDMNALKKQTAAALAAAAASPSKASSLSTTEMSTIRQLISGYRESATFLYRSADELEQLISHSN